MKTTVLLLLLLAACGTRPSGLHGGDGNGGAAGSGTGGAGGGPGGTHAMCVADLARFAPCGGDVVGSWTASDACVDAGSLASTFQQIPGCKDAQVDVAVKSSTGSMTYAADGTYTSDLSATIASTFSLSARCLQVLMGGGAGNASQACATLGANGSPDGTTTCKFAADRCTCSASGVQSLGGEGTYKAAIGQLSTSDGEVSDYCLKDANLELRPTDASGGPGILLVLRRVN